MCSEDPAWKLLISHTLATDERNSLIATIFADDNQVKAVGKLSGDDGQAFIDVVYQVSPCSLLPPNGWLLLKLRLLGIGCPHTTDPQEVFTRYIQDLWPSSLASAIADNSIVLRPSG